MDARRGRMSTVEIRRFGGAAPSNTFDEVVTEEPLEIRVYYIGADGSEHHESISVTMRTPGNDFELAAGFLFSEGVVAKRDDIDSISYCVDTTEEQQYNIVNVHLSQTVRFDPQKMSRHSYTTSSCGVCGKASLEALHVKGCGTIESDFSVGGELVARLPDELRKAQLVFDKTGGLHASGLFDLDGKLELIREDVGRHNALDKLIGYQLMNGRVPLERRICALSGRIGFELVQKSLVAGIPMLVAVGAPSSLAVDLARDFNITLVGFVRKGGFNVYSGMQRVAVREESAIARREKA